MNRRKEIAKYLLSDYLASAVTWALFWTFRKFYIESQKFGISVPFQANGKFYAGLFIIPLCWIFLYAMWGLYANVYRKSRITEIKQLFLASTVGVVVIFFTLLLNDTIVSYRSYYISVSVLFSLQFFISVFFSPYHHNRYKQKTAQQKDRVQHHINWE